nr:potassium-transporting ATPase subunit F [Frigoribacterium sp. VKM Ac-2530]
MGDRAPVGHATGAAGRTRSSWTRSHHRARPRLPAHHRRRHDGRRPRGEGGGAPVTALGIVAVVLAVAALVYLVVALVAPEKF